MPMDEWEIHPDDLSPAQREVADLIGFENYLKLIDVYAAETIYIPKRDSFERIARNQRIVEEYIRARPLDGQMSFFPPERKVKY